MEDVEVRTGSNTEESKKEHGSSEETGLAEWSPSELVDQLETDFQRLWGMLWPRRTQRWLRHLPQAARWLPSTDVLERDDSLVVRMDLPGMSTDDIEVRMERDALIVEGEREQTREREDADYYLAERSYGRFYRRVPLWDGASPDEVDAQFRDGVLEVRVPLPKERQAEPRRIAVRK